MFIRLIIIFYITGKILLAEELQNPYESARSLGMGGAFTATASDQNSIWTNPAGISRIRKSRARSSIHLITIPNAFFALNASGSGLYSNLKTLSAIKDKTKKAEEITNIVKKLDSKNPQQMLLQLGAAPLIFWEMKSNIPAAFGLITKSLIKIAVDPTDKSALTQVTTDEGAIFGTSFTTRSNRFNFGLQTRYLKRYIYDYKIDLADFVESTILKKSQSEGDNVSGLGIDIGVMWTLADFWFPTIGFSVFNLPLGCKKDYLNPFTEKRQNICGTVFTGKITNPDSIFLLDPTDMRIGFSISPRLNRKTSLRFGLDMHHLYLGAGSQYYGLPGVDVLKQLHAGAELFFGNLLERPLLSFRSGFSQGFTSMGVGVRLGFLTIEAVSYGKDISSTSSPLEERRSLIALSAEF